MPLKHTVEEVQLKNGSKGLLIHVPGATAIHYDYHFRAGTLYVSDPNKSQAAHIMEHMAFGPNARFKTGEAFSQELGRNGARYNAHTSGTGMNYELTAPVMEWDRVLNLYTLVLAQPRYTEQTLEAEKSNVREELNGYANNHGRILWQEIMQNAGLPRWYDPQEYKTINNVQLTDAQAHFKATHTTNNLKFLVVGDMKGRKEAVIASIEALPLPKGSLLPRITETARPQGPVFVRRQDLPALTFNLRFFKNDRILTMKEFRALSVLSYTLSGTHHSRILGEARRRGLCYGMGCDYASSPSGVAEFSVGGRVSFENAAELFKLIIRELRAVAEHGITDEELQQAKDYRLGSLQMGTDTVGSLANWYAGDYYEFDRIDPVKNMPMRIARTTTQGVKDILNEFLSAGLWTLGGIGNSTAEDFQQYYDLFKNELVDKKVGA